jgi:3-methyladenine DNA glycosylase AlkC
MATKSPAPKLKDFFDANVVRGIARDLRRAHAVFDEDAFTAECLRGLRNMELTERGRHVADVMHRFLPQPFARAAAVLVASLGPEHAGTEDFGMAPFRYMGHMYYVATYGLDARDVDTALDAQYEVTKRFTAEFSIRPFLIAHREHTLARLRTWSRDPSPHVRRLVSEGTRPRLPWAPRLPEFQRDPAPVLALLELLKDDDERYVQRSVANNLNDIAKDHPDVVIDVCRRWLVDASEGRRYIVSHALRSLIKQKNKAALDVLGFADKPAVAIENVAVPARAKIGDKMSFACDVVSTSKRAQELNIDYAVHFVKANGTTSAKVFKLRRVRLQPKQRVTLNATVSFAQMTTRAHHPGRHTIELVVNGVVFPLARVHVTR